MVDSHTHLFLCDSPENEAVARARDAGVTRMLNVGLGGEANAKAIAGAERHEEVFASVGCHPTEAGIDYYRESASPSDQRRAFEAQVEIARELDLPIVIHARDPEGETSASDEIFDLLEAKAGGQAVILHCFSAPWRVEDAAERGWYCSFAGHVSYPGSGELREAAAKLPDELVLVETDAPYLAPQTMRGKPNEPAYVVDTARVVAEARGVSYAELEAVVEANARAVFGW